MLCHGKSNIKIISIIFKRFVKLFIYRLGIPFPFSGKAYGYQKFYYKELHNYHLIIEMHLKIKRVPAVPDIEHLKKLALIGAINKTIKVSSNEFQKHTGSSSKTAARKIKQLEEEGLIERKIVPGGQLIKMTEKGIEILKNEYMEYSSIFSPESEVLELEGNVLKGLGEGQYYINIPGYKKQFEEKLNFVPFPGTLNVKLSEDSLDLRTMLKEMKTIRIEGFNDGERTFGGGNCYLVSIGGVDAAVVAPERTHYPSDLIEIIAPVKLRDALSLKDGDRVVIQVKKQGMESQE